MRNSDFIWGYKFLEYIEGARDYLDLRAPFTFDQSSWETSEVYMSGHKRLRSFRKEG